MTSTVIDTKAIEIAVPRGEITSAQLVVRGGAAGLRIRTAALGQVLTKLRFEGKRPTVTVADDRVVLDFRGFFIPHPKTWFKGGPEVLLSDDVSWTLDLSGGVADMRADLRSVWLEALTLTGGMTDVQLHLPHPDRRVQLRIDGDVTKTSIHRPAGVPLRVRASGSAIEVHHDGAGLPFAVGPWAWETPGFDAASGGYEMEIEGTATSLDITEESESH